MSIQERTTTHFSTQSRSGCSFFAVASAGVVGGACVGAGVGLLLSSATFGASVIAGIVIGAFLGAVIAAATYHTSNNAEILATHFALIKS